MSQTLSVGEILNNDCESLEVSTVFLTPRLLRMRITPCIANETLALKERIWWTGKSIS